MGLFRCWFGFLCLINVLLIWPDMYMWFGNQGLFPSSIHQSFNQEFRFQIYAFTGYSDLAITIMKVLGLTGGLGLMLGLFPRTSAFFLWLVASSYSWRNSGIHNSGDNLIRIGCFFLMFVRSDASFSVKNYLASHHLWPVGKSEDLRFIPAWPQRTLQIQLCIVYFVTAILKLQGESWRDGSAVGLVLQLGEFIRFPVPDLLMTSTASSMATYFTVGFELLFPFLVWWPLFRVPMLVCGLFLHGALEWTMNIQLFQWIITSYYLLFIEFDKRSLKSDALSA